jgi:hypothetical protein
MKNLVKVIPAKRGFDLEVIKKGSIYMIEDVLSCSKVPYIVESVTEEEMSIVSLTRGMRLMLRPEHIGSKFNFISEMELVEKKSCDSKSEDIKNESVKCDMKNNIKCKEESKSECESRTNDYAQQLMKMFKAYGFDDVKVDIR